jgi:hypothetical protein
MRASSRKRDREGRKGERDDKVGDEYGRNTR